MSAQNNKPLDTTKKRLFYIILLIFPIVVLLLLEIFLRIINYGGNQALFITGPEKDISHYWMCNQNVGRRYFFMQDTKPNPPKDLFLKDKPKNGYRIFVLGGSTTAGFPYGYNLMFPRILNFQLADIFPDKKIEVVNTAMSAVNSYTLLDFIDEILDKQPDALLIYAGHNEFYGALGVASTESLGKNQSVIYTYLKLRRFKIFLLVRDIVGMIRKGAGKLTTRGTAVDPTETLMSRIVAEQTIPYKSQLYHAGLKQYRENLERILKKAHHHNIPVLLSELVCNVRDRTPFISTKADTFPTAERAFTIGKRLEQQGDYTAAKTALTLAKDLDALRFRASEDMNDIIHDLAAKYDIPVVPLKSRFEAESQHHIIGDDLMVDHLHPRMSGYFIMADAFLHAMKNNGFLSPEWKKSRFQPLDEYENSWGITALDTAAANLGIRYLKGGWPFQPQHKPNRSLENFKPSNKMETLAYRILTDSDYSVVAGHYEMAKHYEKEKQFEKAFEEYKAAFYAIPFEFDFYEGAVKNLLRLKDKKRALDVLLFAGRYGSTPFTSKWTGQLLADAGRYQEALPHLEQSYQNGQDDPVVLRYLAAALLADGQQERARQIANQVKKQIKADSTTFDPSLDENNRDVLYSAMINDAKIKLREKKYKEALARLKNAHSIHQTLFTVKWIGILSLKYGHIEEAIDLLEQAAAQLPEDFEVRYNLCNAYIMNEQKENAERVLREMEELRSNFADPQNLRGRVQEL